MQRRKNTDVETGVQDISFRPHIPIQANLHWRVQSAVSIPSSPHTTASILPADSFQHPPSSVHREHNLHTSHDHKHTSYSQWPVFMGTGSVRECDPSLMPWQEFLGVCIKRETLFVSPREILGFKTHGFSQPSTAQVAVCYYCLGGREREGEGRFLPKGWDYSSSYKR